jgi:hypothetical protein
VLVVGIAVAVVVVAYMVADSSFVFETLIDIERYSSYYLQPKMIIVSRIA